MALYNIVDESLEKLENEPLNTANLVSFVINSDEKNKTYECMESPIFTIYSEILNNNIEVTKFEPIYKYKPEYMSYYMYGTSSYDYLILHANGLTSKKEFKSENFLDNKVKYYSKNIIKMIESEMMSYDKKETIVINTDNYLLYNI